MRSSRASGKYRQVTREKPAATNFFLAFPPGKGQCWRNHLLTSKLTDSTNGCVAGTQEEGVVHVSMVPPIAATDKIMDNVDGDICRAVALSFFFFTFAFTSSNIII